MLAACVTSGATLLSNCSQNLSQLLSNKQLGVGASDASIQAAVPKAKLNPSAACCTALNGFLTAGKASYGSCTCDATIQASHTIFSEPSVLGIISFSILSFHGVVQQGAQSKYQVNGAELISSFKAAAYACASKGVKYPEGLTCPSVRSG